MSNINRSNEIILAIAKSVKEQTNYDADRAGSLAYARAFGFAWAILSEEQREMMLETYLKADN